MENVVRCGRCRWARQVLMWPTGQHLMLLLVEKNKHLTVNPWWKGTLAHVGSTVLHFSVHSLSHSLCPLFSFHISNTFSCPCCLPPLADLLLLYLRNRSQWKRTLPCSPPNQCAHLSVPQVMLWVPPDMANPDLRHPFPWVAHSIPSCSLKTTVPADPPLPSFVIEFPSLFIIPTSWCADCGICFCLKNSLAWPHSFSITALFPCLFTASSVPSAPVPSFHLLLKPSSGISQNCFSQCPEALHVIRSSDAVISILLLPGPSVAFGTPDSTPAHFAQGWGARVTDSFLPALQLVFLVLLLGLSHLPDLYTWQCLPQTLKVISFPVTLQLSSNLGDLDLSHILKYSMHTDDSQGLCCSRLLFSTLDSFVHLEGFPSPAQFFSSSRLP